MSARKFVVGDVVRVEDSSNANVRPGFYTIIKALPLAGPLQQYRVKNSLDSFERVLDEAVLQAVIS